MAAPASSSMTSLISASAVAARLASFPSGGCLAPTCLQPLRNRGQVTGTLGHPCWQQPCRQQHDACRSFTRVSCTDWAPSCRQASSHQPLEPPLLATALPAAAAQCLSLCLAAWLALTLVALHNRLQVPGPLGHPWPQQLCQQHDHALPPAPGGRHPCHGGLQGGCCGQQGPHCLHGRSQEPQGGPPHRQEHLHCQGALQVGM